MQGIPRPTLVSVIRDTRTALVQVFTDTLWVLDTHQCAGTMILPVTFHTIGHTSFSASQRTWGEGKSH